MIEVPVRNSERPALIDDADLPLVEGRAWRLFGRGYAGWNTSRKGHRITYGMHRLVVGLPCGYQVSGRIPEVHHINGDRLDNRRHNLEVLTRSEHLRRRRRPPGWSAMAGVNFDHRQDRWRVSLHLGCFDTEAEAIAAAKAAWSVLSDHDVRGGAEVKTPAARPSEGARGHAEA